MRNAARLPNPCLTDRYCRMPTMMAFTTPCCASADAARRWLAALLLGVWLALAGSASAADASAVRQAAIRATPQGYALDADIDVVLNPTLEDALLRGINLYFLAELELSRPRGWWWFDEDIVEQERGMRIYYHLLLRRYVVESGYVTRTAESLGEALTLLGRINGWQVLDRGALKTGRRYDGRLRLRLDIARLPKPLSIGGVSGDKWEMATPWYEWAFDAPAAPPAPALP
jgi:hypothetical protein